MATAASAISKRNGIAGQYVTLRQHHRPGERMFVHYAGATIPVHDPHNGQIHQAAIFVAVLGASGYTFAEATASQDLGCWIGSHIRSLEYFGGAPQLWRARHKRVYAKDWIMRRKTPLPRIWAVLASGA